MPGVLPEEIDLPGAMTVSEAADELGVSQKSIFRLVQRGKLYVVGRVGRCQLVASTEIAVRVATSGPPPSTYTATRPGELCTITQSGPDAAVVTVLGARAKRVLATVIPPDRQVPEGDGWRVPVAVLPLLRASMRLRGVHVELIAA